MKRIIANCFLRFLAVSLFSYLGALTFVHIENRAIPNDNETSSALNELKNRYSCRLHNITDKDLKVVAETVLDLTRNRKWTIGDGLQLTFETLTTIGYGSNAPATEAGRILIIFYALAGIPLYLYFLQIVGEAINKAINKAIWFVENKCLKVKEPKSVELKCLVGFTVSLVTYVFCMAFLVSVLYDWSYATSIYVLFITFTTVGFGDFVINNDKMPIVVVGLCLVSGLFDAAMCYMEKKEEERRKKGGMKCCCMGKNTGDVQEEDEHEQHGLENKGTSMDAQNA